MPRHLVIQVGLLPWLKDSALEDSENLPEPEVLAVFAAAPNRLLFYLGQHHQAMAPCIVYEFDFDRQAHKTYQPSFTVY